MQGLITLALCFVFFIAGIVVGYHSLIASLSKEDFVVIRHADKPEGKGRFRVYRRTLYDFEDFDKKEK